MIRILSGSGRVGRALQGQTTILRPVRPVRVLCPTQKPSWQQQHGTTATTTWAPHQTRSGPVVVMTRRQFSAMMDDWEGEDYDPDMWEDGYMGYLEYLESAWEFAAVQYDVSQKTVPQLKALLRERNLKVAGRKLELQQRLLEEYRRYTDISTIQNEPSSKSASPAVMNSPKDDDTSDPPPPPPVYCFDAANNYRLVARQTLEQLGRLQDAWTAPEPQSDDDTTMTTVHEAQSLIDLLPPEMVAELSEDVLPHLMEIVLDVGKRPFAWVDGKRHFLGDEDSMVTMEQLQQIVEPLHFGPDNRAGINGSLHRISAIRNREGNCIGLTLRVGRFVPGNAMMIADVLAGMPHSSILVVGDPGSGKTSIIRDVARFLAEQHSLLIIDTSCEIGGSGDVPHECIGLSRRMQVKNIESQADVMIECVQNHTPAVMVIDEIGREAEVRAALTCKERGVRIIASAHGNLSGLVRNASLCDLIGGVDVVTVGDRAAKKEANRRGQSKSGIASKLTAQRRGPPIFDIIIELKRGYLNEWHVVLNCASAVDSILSDGEYLVQARYRESSGASTIETKTLSKHANALDEIREKGFRHDSLLNTIPVTAGRESDQSVDPTLDPYSTNCRTCPNCRKTFSSREGFLMHAQTKQICRKELPYELLQYLREEKEVGSTFL
eukprot:scaffold44883_cov160-Amphora_coffeaeformis.AAC.1